MTYLDRQLAQHIADPTLRHPLDRVSGIESNGARNLNGTPVMYRDGKWYRLVDNEWVEITEPRS